MLMYPSDTMWWSASGDFEDDPRNTAEADHLLVSEGYISIVAHNVDCTDYAELNRLKDNNFDIDFN